MSALSVTERPAAFVMLRLLGAVVALTGGTFLGLLLSSAWCLESARDAALVGVLAGGAILFGMASSVLAWWPRASLIVLVAGAIVTAAAVPVVLSQAHGKEKERAEATRDALRRLGTAVEAHAAAGGELPKKDLSAEALLRETGLDSGLPVLDGWDGPIRFVSRPDGWSLVARCRCGIPDLLEEHSHGGPAVTGPRADMTWRDGELQPWHGDDAE